MNSELVYPVQLKKKKTDLLSKYIKLLQSVKSLFYASQDSTMYISRTFRRGTER